MSNPSVNHKFLHFSREMDLAMTRAQKRLSEFYAKFPEFRNG